MNREKVRLLHRRELSGEVEAPGSKSYTHRALIIASVCNGTSRISGLLISRDTLASMNACISIGAGIKRLHGSVEVDGSRPSTPDDVINVENSGTTLRLMTSLLCSTPGGYSVLTGDSSIRKRPMQPLLDSIADLGGHAFSTRGDGCAPIVVKGGGLEGGETEVRADISSQFVSSLLVSSPLAKNSVNIRVKDAVSKPYIDATIAVMSSFGIQVKRDGYNSFFIEAGQSYRPSIFRVPGDFSSASFIIAAVALVGGRVKISNLSTELPQGDSRILDIAQEMGLKVTRGEKQVTVEHDGSRLKPLTVNLADTPDLLPVVACMSLMCEGDVEISGVGHAKYKETDRISVINEEFRRAGVKVEKKEDGLKISPGKIRPATLSSHGDHRMFMAFSLVSLLSGGIVAVQGEESVDVSYPSFLEDLQKVGAVVVRE